VLSCPKSKPAFGESQHKSVFRQVADLGYLVKIGIDLNFLFHGHCHASKF